MKILILAVGTVVFIADVISRYQLKKTLERGDLLKDLLKEESNGRSNKA